MDDTLLKHQSEELLEKFVEQWKKNDIFSDEISKKTILNDPVINLLMRALTYQTNVLHEQITDMKGSILKEFVRQIVPHDSVNSMPAVTVMHAKPVENIEIDDSLIVKLCKKAQNKIKFKDKGIEDFTFRPLIKTKILNANITSVNKKAHQNNTYDVRITGNGEPIGNLSGISFYFPEFSVSGLTVHINGKSTPVISMYDYESLPLSNIFQIENCFLNYTEFGDTATNWLDVVAYLEGRLFYLGTCDTICTENEITLQITFNSENEISLSTENFLMNCFPIANVEIGSIDLSNEDKNKIKKLDLHTSKSCKYFLNLLPHPELYSNENVSFRRFGTERINATSLHGQNTTEQASHDVYVILKKLPKDKDTDKDVNRLSIEYLLTDGARANGIPEDASLKIDSPNFKDNFDDIKKNCSILMKTQGGKNEIEYEDALMNNIAKYYHLTNNILVTKADIKSFCLKELTITYNITNIHNEDITLTVDQATANTALTILVEILIKSSDNQKYANNNDKIKQLAGELKYKLCIRSGCFYSFRVQVKIV